MATHLHYVVSLPLERSGYGALMNEKIDLTFFGSGRILNFLTSLKL